MTDKDVVVVVGAQILGEFGGDEEAEYWWATPREHVDEG